MKVKNKFRLWIYNKKLEQIGFESFHNKKAARRQARRLKKVGYHSALRRYDEKSYEWETVD